MESISAPFPGSQAPVPWERSLTCSGRSPPPCPRVHPKDAPVPCCHCVPALLPKILRKGEPEHPRPSLGSSPAPSRQLLSCQPRTDAQRSRPPLPIHQPKVPEPLMESRQAEPKMRAATESRPVRLSTALPSSAAMADWRASPEQTGSGRALQRVRLLSVFRRGGRKARVFPTRVFPPSPRRSLRWWHRDRKLAQVSRVPGLAESRRVRHSSPRFPGNWRRAERGHPSRDLVRDLRLPLSSPSI